MEVKMSVLPGELGSERLLSAEQIMELLHISKSKLYALMRLKKNQIPSVKMGGARRFPLVQVREWMGTLKR